MFVQWPHPGGEHRPDRVGHKAWSINTARHAHKFMLVRVIRSLAQVLTQADL